jgi:hypothetical protein
MKCVIAFFERLGRSHRLELTMQSLAATQSQSGLVRWIKRPYGRFTQDVDILLRRNDLVPAQAALTAAGFHYSETLDVHMFLDSPDANPRQAVRVLFANEKVQQEYLLPTPDLSEAEAAEEYRVLNLEALVRMKLTSFRRKDQVHVLDMIGVGLIDASWPARFPPALAGRLQELLDDPNG